MSEINQELDKRDQLARAHQAAQALTDQLAVALDQRREEMADLRARAEDAEMRLAAVIAECRRVASAWCDIASGIIPDLRRIEAAARGGGTP